ncbi:MAG: A/G-specific adenine glycosylase [Alphaproteobacteria bacterium]|nr:A/G-specific adenine glycosylase [Alphaproteobacteria bacterium]MCB9929912.1 A/G-specific adenine glycosylase [Alphaproteobacteria bacterium]
MSAATPAPITPFAAEEVAAIRAAILGWYDANRRDLPWRAPAGRTADPYHVWLSEIMLQQTTVAAVKGYFAEFLRQWPSVADLAAAPLDEVMRAWAGLGYYARARNLHRCAQTVVADFGGAFPADAALLRSLPGIGDYTAGAIAAIAFGHRAAPVDANIERVVSRLTAITEPTSPTKPLVRKGAAALEDPERPGDWAQALMDLGSAVCTSRSPKCLLCPAVQWCQAQAAGNAESLPVKPAKPARPLRTGIVYWLERADGAVLLRKRAGRGMLGGLWEFPSAGWDDRNAHPTDPAIEALARTWEAMPGRIAHGFTHFEVALEVRSAAARPGVNLPEGSRWTARQSLGEFALPTLMKKVAKAMGGAKR